MKIKIITDSANCISPEMSKKLDITIVPLSINFTDKSYQDNVDVSIDEFIPMIAGLKKLPKTSQPSPDMFLKVFEEAKTSGDAILCITMSSLASGTYQSAILAKEMLNYEHIEIVDSKLFVGGFEILTREAVRLRDAMKLAELANYLRELCTHIHIYSIVDSLDHLYRGGRLSRMEAILGSFLRFKPVVYFPNGQGGVAGKGRGTKQAFDIIVNEMEKYPVNKLYPIIMGYSDSKAPVDNLKEYLFLRIGRFEYIETQLSPSMYLHVGPGAGAIYWVSLGIERPFPEIPNLK